MNNLISSAINSLTPEIIEKLAIESGFQKRAPKKITPVALLHLYCLESINKTPSHNDIAGTLNDLTGKLPSRQAVAKRVNPEFELLVEKVLGYAIATKYEDDFSPKEDVTDCFGRVLVQDSTVVQLPIRLFAEYSGSSNQHKSVCSARIQGTYDLVARCFVSFSIDPYSKNDRKAAPELSIQPNDLVLRDRGYNINEECRRIDGQDAFYVSRHIASAIYRDPKTNKEIDLAGELKKCGKIDMNVWLNDDKKTLIRLVASPISEEIANLRRMKAKKETKGHNPSKNVLFLMSWTIFTTNLFPEKFTFKTLLLLYGLRWRIETIFKTWKSNMSFAIIHNVSAIQLRVLLKARLISIVITMHCIYNRCALIIPRYSDRILSLTKVMRYIQVKSSRLQQLIEIMNKNIDNIIRRLIKYCTYEKRERQNYVQMEKLVLNKISIS